MDELKQALESTLYLLCEQVPTGTFKNYNEHNGIDEGVVQAMKMINDARQVLKAHMTEQEIENSPLF